MSESLASGSAAAVPNASLDGKENFQVRFEVCSADRQSVRDIVESTGFFYPPEVNVAVELVDERLAKGESSGYHFVFLDAPGAKVPLGYACYGPIACTAHSFDLYWIAVHRSAQGHGAGRELLRLTEQQIIRHGGHRLYAETSGRPQYEPTRSFYHRSGFTQAAVFPHFYDEGDDKVVYVKVLA